MRIYKCITPLKLRVRGAAKEIDLTPGMMFTAEDTAGHNGVTVLEGIFAPRVAVTALTLKNCFEELTAQARG